MPCLTWWGDQARMRASERGKSNRNGWESGRQRVERFKETTSNPSLTNRWRGGDHRHILQNFLSVISQQKICKKKIGIQKISTWANRQTAPYQTGGLLDWGPTVRVHTILIKTTDRLHGNWNNELHHSVFEKWWFEGRKTSNVHLFALKAREN